MICPRCKHPAENGEKYCIQCGKRFFTNSVSLEKHHHLNRIIFILFIMLFLSFFIFFTYSNNNINILDSFEMKLTKNQEENIDKKNSGFLIFKKEYGEDGYYQPILDSNNITIENGIIKAHIDNTLLMISDENETWTKGHIFTRYRIESPNTKIVEGVYIKNKYASLNETTVSFSEKVSYYIDNEDNRPLLNHAMNEEGKKIDSAFLMDSIEKNGYLIYSNGFKITNQHGDYTENWESSPIITIHSGLLSHFNENLENASLIKEEEYVIVFYFQDISGKKTYSKIKKINW